MSTTRKSVDDTSRRTLAETITTAGKMNAASRHRRKDKGSITSLSGLTSDHERISTNNPLLRQAEASSSKISLKASAANNRPNVGSSSHAPSGMIYAQDLFLSLH
jgi:hypothetical protein